MYLGMVRRWFSTLHLRFWRKGLMRSGMVTGLILAALVAGLGIAYRERGRGNLHKLTAKIVPPQVEVVVPRPGGKDPIQLTRARLMGDTAPEFLSVTMLPGRGMNMLQITAYVPGMGEVNLMASPPIEGAASAMTGTGADANGQASLAMGGAFEAPWADSIWGAPSSTAGHVSTVWHGRPISLPSMDGTSGAVTGGLILAAPADSATTTALPDGGQAIATFNPGNFGAHWPSKTRLTVTAMLTSRSLELTMVAQNTGDVAEPIGIGWHPQFAVLGGNRGQLRLRVPGEKRAEVRDREKGLPTGRLVPVAGTPYDYTMHGGVKLGTSDLDDCFVALRQDALDLGPVAELSDPANNYGLRLTALSSTIKAMRVVAPASGKFVSIEPQFNYPDPFGREWAKDTDTGIVILQPGQSTEWKVRLDLFSLASSTSQM
jgi:aldose 1-epimerase